MSTNEQVAANFREAIDTIEEAYEFMLAFAAQGKQVEQETEGASQIRGFLERFRKALNTISAHTEELLPMAGATAAFSKHFIRDTDIMKSVLDILTAQTNITSDMIDNTNGMITVRSFLTDVFFIDQVLLPVRAAE